MNAPPASSLSSFPLVPFLPRELFDIIIDHYAADPSTLACLALVCHAFAARARPHKWRSVLLYPTTAPSRCARLYALLLADPALAPMIREFAAKKRPPSPLSPDMQTRMSEHSSSDGDEEGNSDEDGEDSDEYEESPAPLYPPSTHTPYTPHDSYSDPLALFDVPRVAPHNIEPELELVGLSTDPSFPCVLRLLPRLSSLSLVGLPWSEQSCEVRTALRAVLRGPGLTHLAFEEGAVPFYVLDSAPALRHLLFGEMTTITFPSEPHDEAEDYYGEAHGERKEDHDGEAGGDGEDENDNGKACDESEDEDDDAISLDPNDYPCLRVKLHTLRLGMEDAYFFWVLFDVSALKSISVRLPLEIDSSDCLREHFSTGNILERLFLDCMEDIVDMPLPIFPYFPALRTLVIVYPLWLEIPWAPQLARLLTQLTQHRLDTLTLILIAQFENSLYERGEHLPADWIPLDTQVARMRPREVIVQVHPNSGKGERVEGLEVIENGLPHTAASCILRVERLSVLPRY